MRETDIETDRQRWKEGERQRQVKRQTDRRIGRKGEREGDGKEMSEAQ